MFARRRRDRVTAALTTFAHRHTIGQLNGLRISEPILPGQRLVLTGTRIATVRACDNGPRPNARGAVVTDVGGIPLSYTIAEAGAVVGIRERFCLPDGVVPNRGMRTGRIIDVTRVATASSG